eukprot:1901505-Rhodomonas_salina.1
MSGTAVLQRRTCVKQYNFFLAHVQVVPEKGEAHPRFKLKDWRSIRATGTVGPGQCQLELEPPRRALIEIVKLFRALSRIREEPQSRLSVKPLLRVGCVATINTRLAIGHSGLCRAYY